MNSKDHNPQNRGEYWIAVLGRALCLAACLVACLSFGADATAQSILGVAVKKHRNSRKIWFTILEFHVRYTSRAAPPLPTFTVDLYDEDPGADDGRGINITEGSNGVTRRAWRRVAVGGGFPTWDCFIRTGAAVEDDVTDFLPGDWPDPEIEIEVKITFAPNNVQTKKLTHAAPDLPSVGVSDFGIASPSNIANGKLLAGERISALSRGFDDISRLPVPGSGNAMNQAALYFACEQDSVVGSTDGESPGRVFVLDGAGDLWPEDLYAANYDPKEAMLGTPRYLNVNTAPAGSQTATNEIYFVREGTDDILYSPTGDPAAAGLYLDLLWPSRGVSGLAVEDVAPRGVWGPGDRVLYAFEDGQAIYTWAYGGTQGYLSLPYRTYLGNQNFLPVLRTFDGPKEIEMPHFEWNAPQHPSLKLGNIRALAVSSPGRETPEPSDRNSPEILDYFPVIPRGIGAPTHLFGNGSNVLSVGALAASHGLTGGQTHGVARSADGYYYVSYQGGAGEAPRLLELDQVGRWLQSYPLPGGAGNIGLLDLAWDGDSDPATSRLWGGSDGATVFEFDPWAGFTGRYVALQGYREPLVQALAIAQLDLGNGPAPVFVAAQNNSPLYFFDMQGRLLRELPNAATIRGLAWDNNRETLWAQVDSLSGGYLLELDPSTGQPTGQEFHGDRLNLSRPSGLEITPLGNAWDDYTFLTANAGDPNGVIAYHGPFAYGPADGGQISFKNSPRLGTPDFRITLGKADPGTWSVLYMGAPVAAPGIALPPALSSSMLLLELATAFPISAIAPTIGGSSELSLQIPMVPGLAGSEHAFQWIVFKPSMLPVTLSDAGVIYLR